MRRSFISPSAGWFPLVSLSVVGAALAFAPSARAAPNVPAIRWTPCGSGFPGFDCAVARVPLDYGRLDAGTTEVALARLAATDPEHKIGTLFYNPGGPGGSGVSAVLDGVGDYFRTLLQGRFDVVGFDPRGVGSSNPLRCFESEAARDEYFAGFGQIYPYLPEQDAAFFEQSIALSGHCDGNAIREHMSTADVVRDLDLLRRAVGDEGLTFVGASYGSFIGNTYANLFPNEVRALVIDGVLDPRLWSSGLQVVSDRVATGEEFTEFLRLCDEAGAECALAGPEGAAARFDGLAQALLDEPLELDDGFVYSYDVLVLDALSAMYAPETWGGPDGFAALFDTLAEAVADRAGSGQQALALRQSLEQRCAPPPPLEPYDNSFDAYYGNQCADTEYSSSLADFSNTADYAASGSIFGPLWWWGNASCANWPVSADRYTGPWTASTSAPVLVVGNYFDGVTDYAGAVAASELLQNSQLLSYAGWGHTALGRNDCVSDHVAAYLLDGRLPPDGTVCAANPNPFVQVPSSEAIESRSALMPRRRLPPLRPTSRIPRR